MCSQYYLQMAMLKEITAKVDCRFAIDYQQSITYYPSNEIPVLMMQQHLILDKLSWGYHLDHNKLVINARSETLNQKKLFQDDLKWRRCLILATGFYEWDDHKRKFGFENINQHLLYLAGIYNLNNEVTIITTKANLMMEEIHDRMPLIFDFHQAKLWLEDKNINDLLTHRPESLVIASGFRQTSLF